MTIHTPRSRHAVTRRKLHRDEDLRARVETVLSIMRDGHVLHCHFDRREGPSWTLSPGNWRLLGEVAQQVINKAAVAACGDGLFTDGPSQTYRYVDDGND